MSRYIDADALREKWLCLQGHDFSPSSFVYSIDNAPTVDAVPVDFINQKIVELHSCAIQHFDDGHEILATCVFETMRLLGNFVKEWREKGASQCG